MGQDQGENAQGPCSLGNLECEAIRQINEGEQELHLGFLISINWNIDIEQAQQIHMAELYLIFILPSTCTHTGKKSMICSQLQARDIEYKAAQKISMNTNH